MNIFSSRLKILLLLWVCIHLSISAQNSIYNCDNELFHNNTNFRLFSINISEDFSAYSFVEITTQDWRGNTLEALAYNPLKKEVVGIEENPFIGPTLAVIDSLGVQRSIIPFGDVNFNQNSFSAAAISLNSSTYYAVKNTAVIPGTTTIVASPQLFRFNLLNNPVTYDSIPIITTSGTPYVCIWLDWP